MKLDGRLLNTILTTLAVLILLAALPGAILDTLETGRIYLFSRQFLDELPQRFTGPGRLRFVLQPLVAIVLGIRGGIGDARAGRPPYLFGLVLGTGGRAELLQSGWHAVRNLICVGIVLDAIAQLLIYGLVHPGAALVIGPILISVPYAASRALANRVAGLAKRPNGG